MDYPFENLHPDRFQELCQALLVVEFPGVVCYPVGMPDGGRDGIRRSTSDSEGNFTTFQVKFSRGSPNETRKWVLDAANGEVEKVARLKARGANRYVFITNLKGTSHLDVGSMDLLYTELSTLLDIEVHCWWRDDLSRRLDSQWDIKLRYPEILSGQDYLRLIIESKNDENHLRRMNAIKAFVADQYGEDQDVKFKQVELQNQLLDLFVDLPFELNGGALDSLARRMDASFTSEVERTDFAELMRRIGRNADEDIGTATVLLKQLGGTITNQIVIEGAPGQGKSTLAQYLCQVHRIRLLNKTSDHERLPEEHRNAPVLMPIKIDLRDLSEWVSGNDPFTVGKLGPKEQSDRTVEAFLSRLINLKAGGFSFDVNDLVEVARITPLFLAFDGLDEVADIKRRADVITAVTKALIRLRENCPRLRSMITSRPAAFANSPGFETKLFPHFKLGSVRLKQIIAYATNWMNARGIAPNERLEFEAILNEKLELPHLRDLSRNPMQLTILLSLIHTRGSALPDKRTTLYDAYVELFFGRESTKHPFVRQHLDLLQDIHRYLAWVLHSRAEASKGSGTAGRFTSAELKAELQTYLVSEGRSTDVIEDVFNAMLERVVMIVSRIEGTHEFEVQPLREYFAARYLYETAPYSPAGKEKAGTKPDRFDAIARNHHWLNVTRFFCGCFSKGELLDLADRAKELMDDPNLGKSRHPFRLSAMLVADSVFAQSPRATKEITDRLLTPDGIRRIISARFAYHNEEAVRLTGSHTKLLEECYSYMTDINTRPDLIQPISELMIENCDSELIKVRWLQSVPTHPYEYSKWLTIGYSLDVLDRMPSDAVSEIIRGRPMTMDILRTLWLAGHGKIAGMQNSELLNRYVKSAHVYWGPGFKDSSNFYLLALLHHFPMQSRYFGEGPVDMIASTNALLADFKNRPKLNDEECNALSEIERKCYEISNELTDKFPTLEDGFELRNFWLFTTNLAAKLLGTCPIVMCMALTWVHIKPLMTKFDGHPELTDEKIGLVERIAYAKRYSRQWKTWGPALLQWESDEQRILFHTTFWSLAPIELAVENKEILQESLDKISEEDWFDILQVLTEFGTPPNKSPNSASRRALPAGITSKRFAYLLVIKDPSAYARAVFLQYFHGKRPDSNGFTNRFQQVETLNAASDGDIKWDDALHFLASTKRETMFFNPTDLKIPPYVADEVLNNADLYPNQLWDYVQNLYTASTGKKVKAVAVIAKRDKWFSV